MSKYDFCMGCMSPLGGEATCRKCGYTEGTPPKQGAKVTYDGKTYLVDSDVSLEQENENYQTLSFTMTAYKNMPNP